MYTRRSELDDIYDKYKKDPDYYFKRFKPVWKQFKIIFTISLTVVILYILYMYLVPNTREIALKIFPYVFIPIAVINFYFQWWRVRCPRCNALPLRPGFSTRFWFTGKCPQCGILLK